MVTERSFAYRRQIKVSSADMDAAIAGRKTCTIRRGVASVESPKIELSDGRRRLPVYVTRVDAGRSFWSLGVDEAAGEGFADPEELRNDLMHYYPSLRNEDRVTIIWFRLAMD